MQNRSPDPVAQRSSRRIRPSLLRIPHPREYDLIVRRMTSAGNSSREIPHRIVLLCDRSGNPANEQLFLDQVPLPHHAWSYDADDRLLTWSGAYGGGQLSFSHDGLGATGVIGEPNDLVSIQANANAIFDCDVALNTGASYESSGDRVVGLKWDTKSPAWNNADWVKSRLRLTYTYTGAGPFTPGNMSFDFQDNQNQGQDWAPGLGEFDYDLNLITRNDAMCWLLNFVTSTPPPQSNAAPATGPDSVYPYMMEAVEDAASSTIEGAFVIDDFAPNGTLVGLRGVRASAAHNGYYRTAPSVAPFGVFNGQLHIGGELVENSRLRGSTLHWHGLDSEQQRLTGLAPSGSLALHTSESDAVCDRTVNATRLNTTQTLTAIDQHSSVHPQLAARASAFDSALNSSGLDMAGLLVMSPFVRNAKGEMGDSVQAGVNQNMSDIMNSFVPADMWKLVFPSTPPPVLSPELATVASSPITLGYQWQKNGVNIAGANSASYTTPAASMSDQGSNFTVVVNNTLSGTVTSSAARLTVTSSTPQDRAAPTVANDAPNSGIPITTQPVDQTVALGQAATFTVVAVAADPKEFYQNLATAVLTQGLANGSDPNCQLLNGPRAAAWLKTQVANSPVYYQHAQLLFHSQWPQLEKNKLTAQYLADQQQNAATWAPFIDDMVNKAVSDIQNNVVADSTQPNLKADLIADVKHAGAYAKNDNLYWAMAFMTWNTAPGVLVNIQSGMSMKTGSTDGTTLTRLFQTNVAVLTALDPSGFFANRYMQEINTFLATTILPGMFDFAGGTTDVKVIKRYLEKFVANNLASEDQKIAEAAGQIEEILKDEQADAILHDSIEVLEEFASAIEDTLELPIIAEKFVERFSEKWPRFAAAGEVFGSVFIGGVTGLAIFNLVSKFKEWSQLSPGEKAEVILSTSQLGLQIVGAIVQRGVRIGAIFGVDGLSRFQRFAATSRIALTGDAQSLDQGLTKIGNRFARWLGNKEVVLNPEEWEDDYFSMDQLNTLGGDADWAENIFGRNLDEFISTRIGPVFIIAGIGLSIYFITTGQSGVALASDIVNIVGGSLTLFATVGGWLVQGGVIAAEGVLADIIAVSGPLAIIAAIAGLALMIYQLFSHPPDPVKEFVDEYAAPAGFAITSQASAIDYVMNYANPDLNDQTMVGFCLSTNDQALLANPDGSISLGAPTLLPNAVWLARTDGLGISRIMTVIQPDATKPATPVFLSLMSDESISFQPLMAPPTQADTQASSSSVPTVVSQSWLGATVGKADVTSSGGFLVSLNLTIQPVLPDASGNYRPSQASGWLVPGTNGVTIDTVNSTAFTLRMSGMAPNFMRMANLSFLQDSMPTQDQVYGPVFGIPPSIPVKYSVTGNFPAFLTLSQNTGQIRPNGSKASNPWHTSNSIVVTSSLGSASADFKISVRQATKLAAG